MSGSRLVPGSALGSDAIGWIRSFLGDHPVHRLYFECALDALAQDVDNRFFLLDPDRRGLVQSIEFDRQVIATTVGALSPQDLAASVPEAAPGELHLEARHASALASYCATRIEEVDTLRYYLLEEGGSDTPDPCCRLLVNDDLGLVSAFFAAHYPRTIFSAWMLDEPFLGLFEDGELVAAGGTVCRHAGLGAANIGNFLTHPSRRGRSLARRLVGSLVATLRRQGIARFTLGVAESNRRAWRAYEAAGFRLLESRVQWSLAAP
ncbi:MAG: GNAT family N-acetyltransferase [Proteobacteria bacterium]|nr:GNAT family N-acetyltransferase [Pseudomonadota bacterium]MBI3497722.1 GNAT family N-acetyltransferase [Pseudomonadota bacterium]